ncbi:hypothetical protein [Xanthobacter tagetidis]|uniref:Uncharacterized protein n=1 Tax=Xanthobacter tagetidis TaxID=60216 RepID=A0A3L7A4E4_9HYPH|nr:hypothetical protein [Xanthobacter tagetidis]MBB6307698.1 hypothetical protein [Xanthobacter tagetidis]RLP74441.1 hypothetical protein D9R14_18950 [Xanthobacter tagetidis]
MRLFRLLALMVLVAAGLHLGSMPARAHGGCPHASATAAEGGTSAEWPPEAAQISHGGPAAVPFVAPAAIRRAPADASAPSTPDTAISGTAQALVAVTFPAPAGDCGRDGAGCCRMPACGAVCHTLVPADAMVLPDPARVVRLVPREAPDPAAHPAEVALPPPRARG